uniref:Uncharacterized protein n=1 Tax=Arion vulgaris TaxID=1028688 RepID=A0A0B6ZXJ1_9EUPU
MFRHEDIVHVITSRETVVDEEYSDSNYSATITSQEPTPLVTSQLQNNEMYDLINRNKTRNIARNTSSIHEIKEKMSGLHQNKMESGTLTINKVDYLYIENGTNIATDRAIQKIIYPAHSKDAYHLNDDQDSFADDADNA